MTPRGGPVIDRYPTIERSALGAQSAGDALHVVVVPIAVAGVMPDVSAEKMAIFRARVLSMYPLAEIAISAHAPISTSIAVSANAGWDDLPDALYAQRAADAPPANVFYYGMMTLTPTFNAFCVTD